MARTKRQSTMTTSIQALVDALQKIADMDPKHIVNEKLLDDCYLCIATQALADYHKSQKEDENRCKYCGTLIHPSKEFCDFKCKDAFKERNRNVPSDINSDEATVATLRPSSPNSIEQDEADEDIQRDNDSLYTYYQIDFEDWGEDYDFTIVETLDDVRKMLEVAEIHLDDDTRKTKVIVTGVAMTPPAFKNWQEEYLNND